MLEEVREEVIGFEKDNASSGSTFHTISQNFLQHTKNFHGDNDVSMLIVSLFLSRHVAKLATIFSELMNSSIVKERYKSYFANSSDEAVSAAIKLCRHKVYTENRSNNSHNSIALLGNYHFFKHFITTGLGVDSDSADSGLSYFDSDKALLSAIKNEQFDAVIVKLPAVENKERAAQEKRKVSKLRSACKKKGIYFGVDETEIKPSLALRVSSQVNPDFTIVGEALVESQAPFGALIMSNAMYAPWNTPKDCFLQSSTFGGNSLVVSYAVDVLSRNKPLMPAILYRLKCIDESYEERLQAIADYINPEGVNLYRLLGLDVDVTSAHRIQLMCRDGQELLDCTGNYGCSLRGYNPDDIFTDVLERHDDNIDYFSLLRHKIENLSGYQHIIPAVSGASAVDNAIVLARMAKPHKKTIITFNKNYSGKTLLSMSYSQYSSASTRTDSTVFAPYDTNVVYIDPHHKNATNLLVDELSKDDVCMIWFEVVQGYDCLAIPQKLLQSIDSAKKKYGFLVGVDDVLAGVWRTGPFLSFEGKIERPDIVTLAKSLSDMFFPIGLTLVNDSLKHIVAQNNIDFYHEIEVRYKNQLGSHIAFNGLSKILPEKAPSSYDEMRHKIEQAIEDSRVFTCVRGEGGLIKLILNPIFFPTKTLRKMLFEPIASNLLIKHSNLLVFMLRINMPRDLSHEEIDAVTSRLKSGLDNKITVANIWKSALAALYKLPVNSQQSNNPTDSRYFKGKRVLITGATSGIGKSLAIKLSTLGAKLILVGRRSFDDETIRLLTENTECLFVKEDISQADARKRIYERVIEEFYGLDVLINNAGLSLRKSVLSTISGKATAKESDVDRTLSVNYTAAADLSQLFLPGMISQGGGQIVNSQSVVAGYPSPMFACYAASKCALKTFMQTLFVENKAHNISVTDLYLPLVDTPMAKATGVYGKGDLVSIDQVVPGIVSGIASRKRKVYFNSSTKFMSIMSALFPVFSERMIGLKYMVDMNRLLGRDNKKGDIFWERIITKLSCRVDR